jgi:hypothetical protein
VLDKCANPACSAKFRSLRGGRVFVTEVEAEHQSSANEYVRQRQYFWLCNACCRTMTVVFEKGKRFQVVPLPVPASAHRAAS